MNLNKFFYLLSALLLLLAAFIYLSPNLVTSDFIYPDRIDSLYVRFHSVLAVKAPTKDQHLNSPSNLYNPGDLALPYEKFDVKAMDGSVLRGWFVESPDTPANTLLLLHDLDESKINYLDQLKQFHDRGLNVCAMDLRAHGNSEGTEFSPGMISVLDVKMIMDQLLRRKSTHHLIVMGKGLGAAIALQVAAYDGRCDVIVLQSPFDNLNTYLERYAQKKWGPLKVLWYPVFRRKVEEQLQFPIHDLDLGAIAKYVKTPSLFIAMANDEMVYTTEILSIYDSSAAELKELFLVTRMDSVSGSHPGGEEYYNRISEFINTALPRKAKTTRYKKLALNDQQGHH